MTFGYAKTPSAELLPYFTDCHVCLEALLDCVNDCLTPFLFNVKNITAINLEMTFSKTKNKILFCDKAV